MRDARGTASPLKPCHNILDDKTIFKFYNQITN